MTVDCKNFKVNCRGIIYGPGVVNVPSEAIKERLERRVAALSIRHNLATPTAPVEDEPQEVAPDKEDKKAEADTEAKTSDKKDASGGDKSAESASKGASAGGTGASGKGGGEPAGKG